MPEENKHNILFFNSPTMKGLYDIMESWQNTNKKRFLSISIQKDNNDFCCIALTNPTEVVITSSNGVYDAKVTQGGSLQVLSFPAPHY